MNSGSKGIVSLLPALGMGAKDTIPNERSTKEVDKMMIDDVIWASSMGHIWEMCIEIAD